ncbi:hypothetical protein [Galactobacter caseinivorans]|uniref:DUF5050 domain-containing protein n=1 Tax=Galactobacter caseinivorans TaxID=2676123 RepID=A0A496PHJ4_9MICC|nr:hypothetical protein [Galactobacter caseinivorans]RKW69945.1 hypothetical protein DWQ67_10800 [Galactobacter caseinivorans]
MFSNQPIHTSSTQDCGTSSRTRSGGAASGLRRLGAGTAALVLASGLAVGTGLPAQAAAPAPSSAALAPAVTAAKTSGLEWHWANGQAVKPKEIKSGKLSKSDYVTKMDRAQGSSSWLMGVMSDGSGFGTVNGEATTWSHYTKSGFTKLAKGLPGWGDVVQEGDTLYFVGNDGQVLRINEPGKNKQATKLVKISKDARGAVIGNGRVYWEKQISVGKDSSGEDLSTYEVRSASLKGGASRLEARNVSDVQVTDQGVFAASVKPTADQVRYYGIVKLSGGKAKPFLSLSGSAAKKGYKTPGAEKPFTASGHSLVLPMQEGKAANVINLRTSEAWTVKHSKGMSGEMAAVSGGRIAWNASNDDETSNQVYIADLDRATVRNMATPFGARDARINGRSVAWAYGTGEAYAPSYFRGITLNR